MKTRIALLTALLTLAAVAGAREPIADIHLHYKWSQAEVTSVADALKVLDDNQVTLALVTGIPPEHALKLADAAPGRILPALSLYQHSGQEKSRWSFDRGTLARARTALATGRFHAIGEVHMIPGFMAKPDTPVVHGLLRLAAEYRVPFWLHTEFSSPDFMTRLCRTHPDVTFLWAHAGSVLSADDVGKVMTACPNVWMELAARDPWRHRSERITDDAGQLKPDWRALVIRHADRTLVGSDPVWPVEQLDSWDEPDSGWDHVGRFLDYHRQWLAGLPADVERKVRIDNARRLLTGAADTP